MKLGQEVKIAFKNIRTNKLRAFLTMLGIIIGVSAVITMVSLTEGASGNVTSQVQGMGTNVITVSIQNEGQKSTGRSLDYDEAMSLEDLSNIEIASPKISGNVKVRNGEKSIDGSLEGITPNYEQIESTPVESGRFFLPTDLENRYEVVILGSTVAKDLFGTFDPVGEVVKINGMSYKVIGVLEEKGSSRSGSVDDKVLMPLTTGQRLLNQGNIQSVSLAVQSEDQMDSAIAQVKQSLNNIFNGDEDRYNIKNAQDMLETLNSITTTMTLLSGGIASISLLVGGIGIMNIMLVSVTERTREIGIRKALGAKRRDILMQFLIESIVLSSFGGILGLLVGIGGVILASSMFGLSNMISWTMIVLSVGFSVLIGVVFGIFPANKAAKLNPIEALRYE